MKTRILSTMLLALFAMAARTETITPAQLLAQSGVQGGLVVHLGCGDGRLTSKFKINERYLVQGLDTDDAKIREARENIRAENRYGKVTAYRFDGVHLPYADNVVNLIVSTGPSSVPAEEIMRALTPLGVAMIDGKKSVKPWPKEIDEWTHFLHGPDNNAVVQDSVVDAPRSIQWVSKPMWGRSHEEMASMSAVVTARGRVFFITDEAPLESIRFDADWKLSARDAFNGILLWEKDIPQWTDHLRDFRSGPVHLSRRLVAVDDAVYVTLGLSSKVSALDAATGELIRAYEGTEYTEEILADNGVLYLVSGTSEVNRSGGGLSRRGEPEPAPNRFISAIEVASGNCLWKKGFEKDEFLLPLTLALKGGRIFYQSTAGVGCLDAATGAENWQAVRQTPVKRMGFSAPTMVVTENVVLCADRDVDAKTQAAQGGVVWGVHGWNAEGFPRRGKTTLIAYDAATGKELWSAPCTEGYNSPVDIFVVDGVVWIGSEYKGYDLKTGALIRPLDWKVGNVAMAHHRCYRNKASQKFIFTGRAGVEVVSLESGWVGNNSWLRGTCQYGIMPANGLIYVPPDACACVPKVKIPGFFAAAPLRTKGGMVLPESPILEKGPAYGAAPAQPRPHAGAKDWPMYRHDPARSGVTSASLPAKLTQLWRVSLGGKLTQPVASGGITVVASTDTHTIHALRTATGAEAWSYTAGGRIDSSPTLYRGVVLFGAADGWVYALRAADGELVWRFRAAPQERMVGVFGQLESIWPVHGSVLVQNETLYVTAGRSTYLDGGIVFYRLDPHTGEMLSRNVAGLIDPETDKQTGKEDRKIYGFDMEGSGSDLLSGDGDAVYMKHLAFDRLGNRTKVTKPHLFAITGFLDSEWFVRSYWVIEADVQGGWGGWAKAANAAPSGRILCFNDERVWGYGRPGVKGGAAGHTTDQYRLFSEIRPDPDARVQAVDLAAKRRNAPLAEGAGGSLWSEEFGLTVRAMLVTPDNLIVAGPPDVAQKDDLLLILRNEPETRAAYEGEMGAKLQILSAKDGAKIAEYPLDAVPVFDGISAANGKLFLALRDGTVACYGGG